jgi:hypothetical protein
LVVAFGLVDPLDPGLFDPLDPLHAVSTSAAMATQAVSATNLVFLVSMLFFLLASPPHCEKGLHEIVYPQASSSTVHASSSSDTVALMNERNANLSGRLRLVIHRSRF